MKKYAIFYHIWTSPDPLVARFLVDEQLKRLIRVGLREVADVYCAVSGDDYHVLEPVLKHYKWLTVLETKCPKMEYEFGTLKHLYSICRDNPAYEAVMYFHTKGVQFYTRYTIKVGGDLNISAINSWRHYMEYFLMDQWRDAVAALKDFDAAGCCLLEEKYAVYADNVCPFYAGNFWWARTSHISKLEDPRNLIPKEDQPTDEKRHDAERWLGSKSKFNQFKILAGLVWPEGAEGSANLYQDDLEFAYMR